MKPDYKLANLFGSTTYFFTGDKKRAQKQYKKWVGYENKYITIVNATSDVKYNGLNKEQLMDKYNISSEVADYAIHSAQNA